MRHFLSIGGLLLVLSAVGCGSVVQPTASFRKADVVGVTTDGVALRFDVDVANANGFDLPVSAAGYDLKLGGVSVLDGRAEPGGSIPANGKREVGIPVNVTFDRLFKAEKALVESKGNVPYELDGTLEFSAGPMKALGQSVRVPLNFRGTLPLRDAVSDPVALLKTPAGRKFVEMVLQKGVLGDLLGR